MTDKQAVFQVLNRLPENVSLDDISEELRIMAAIRHGRDDVVNGRIKSHEEVEQLLESWSVQWTWNGEIQERIKRYDAGLTVGHSGPAVFAELDNKLKG